MAGSKRGRNSKAGKAKTSRDSRRRAAARSQPGSSEWFGSSAHSEQGLMHLDVRAAGNGLLITASPAEAGDRTEAWQLRLRNDDGGKGLRELAAAFRDGTQHALGGGADRWLAFFPDPQQPGVGSLVSARPGPDPEGPAEILRRADRPLTLWEEAGIAMDGIIAGLDTSLLPEQWEPEDALGCPGCLRPVYDSTAAIGTLLGAGMPVPGLCRFCVSGQTLRTVRQAGLAIPAQQRAVLEALAGA